MIFHANCLPADDKHEIHALFVNFVIQGNLNLSSAANIGGTLWVKVEFENFESNKIQATRDFVTYRICEKPPFNTHSDVPSGTRELKFDLSLHLQ